MFAHVPRKILAVMLIRRFINSEYYHIPPSLSTAAAYRQPDLLKSMTFANCERRSREQIRVLNT